jgi:signal transduction histidine kinase
MDRARLPAPLAPLIGMAAGVAAVDVMIALIRSFIDIPNLSILYLLPGDVLRRHLGLVDRPLELAIPDELPPVSLDYLLIDQVVTNLREKAAKYTPAGAPIRVAVDRVDDRVRVCVDDP